MTIEQVRRRVARMRLKGYRGSSTYFIGYLSKEDEVAWGAEFERYKRRFKGFPVFFEGVEWSPAKPGQKTCIPNKWNR